MVSRAEQVTTPTCITKVVDLNMKVLYAADEYIKKVLSGVTLGIGVVVLPYSQVWGAEVPSAAVAPEAPVKQGKRLIYDGIFGFVSNRTITPFGQEFYTTFTSFWRENADSENYSLNVVERVAQLQGNQIQIWFGQKIIYSATLPNKMSQLRIIAEKAAETVLANIIADAMRPESDEDIGVDEI